VERGREGRGGDRRGGERREESVPIVPVLRNDHCDSRQCISIYNSNNDGKLHKTNFS